MWEAEIVSSELDYLAEISKQSIEGVVQFLLAAYSKMQKERDKLKKELLSKKELGLKSLRRLDNLEIFQPMQIAKDVQLGHSLSGKYTLQRKQRVWLDSLLLVAQKDQKIRVTQGAP